MPAPTSTLEVTPIEHSAGFGCFVRGVDINDLSEPDFKTIEAALYKYKLVVIKDQHALKPVKQHEFNKRFDPDASGLHGHGTAKEVMTRQFKGKRNITAGLPGVPECDSVRMVGKGTFPPGHYGTEEPLELKGSSHRTWHKEHMDDERMEQGNTRFQRFHIDAQMYPRSNNTARVTTLWTHTLPKGDDLTVCWDDGSEQTMKAAPGRTAFLNSCKMFEALSPEDKKWVEHSMIEYAPKPYEFIINCKGTSTGFSIVSEDKETPLEDLDADLNEVQILPLLWPNPAIPSEKALQYHMIIARKIHYKESADGEVTIIDDLREVRRLLDGLQRPFLKGENIIISPQEEGDLALWSNRLLRHSAVDFPESYGTRMCHQCHIQGSDSPAHPVAPTGLPPLDSI